MTLPKLFAIVCIALFGFIGIAAIVKNRKADPVTFNIPQGPLEVELDHEIQTIVPALAVPSQPKKDSVPPFSDPALFEKDLPEADRVQEFFNKNDPKLPIVETIVYKSHVPWQKGRPAWLSDYANYYQTSRHFIARSLNGKPDYIKQDISEGDRFNVLRKDKNIEFYLVVDTSRCKMWFYYIDLDSKEKELIKTYNLGLGRLDSSKTSGLLTPIGIYSLGDRVAIYKPKVKGLHQGKKAELITIFGTRWIPFEKEVGPTTAPAKGFGVHGTPWTYDAEGVLIDNPASIGKYESDGCIRLSTPDMEELFSIIITKPTLIEIVRDFRDSKLNEVE
jgi:hypothetical protein